MVETPPEHVGSVLVVDDEPDILASIAGTLRRKLRGVDILEAPDGPSALEIVRAHDVDVVFTDFRMPGMDGLELLAAVHELDSGMAGIVCTAYPDVGIVERALNEQRIRKFFIKPVRSQDIAEGVAEVLWDRRKDQIRDAIIAQASDLVRDSAPQ